MVEFLPPRSHDNRKWGHNLNVHFNYNFYAKLYGRHWAHTRQTLYYFYLSGSSWCLKDEASLPTSKSWWSVSSQIHPYVKCVLNGFVVLEAIKKKGNRKKSDSLKQT